jgi:hypothetical protein
MPLPPRTQQPLTKPRVLVGEGRDEVNFFEALTAHLGVTDIQVEEYGGKGNLSRYLREFVSARPGRQNVLALGITRDADGNAALAFQGICTLLTNNQLSIPATAGQVAVGTPRVGVYLFPDNQRDGMLEDLCLDSVQTDGAVSCVDEYLRCVARNTGRQPSPPAKARVHIWLASQLVPDLRLGEAAQKGFWPWTAPALAPLIRFLQAL